MRPGSATDEDSCGLVTSVPLHLRSSSHMWPNGLSTFYQQYTEVYGIPVVASSKVEAKSLQRACYLVKLLLADRYDIRNAYYKFFGRVAVIADDENTTDLPEYTSLSSYWDFRSRGLGAEVTRPVSSAGDENLRCDINDRYRLEDIMLHELSHGTHLLGAAFTVPGFSKRLKNAYDNAIINRLWENHYAITNEREYWAVGSTYYFNSEGPYSVHLRDGTELTGPGQYILQQYDLDLFRLLRDIYPCNNSLVNRCSYKDCKDFYFNHVANASFSYNVTGCDDVMFCRCGFEECMARTCHLDGNTFSHRYDYCHITRCPGNVPLIQSGISYEIYTLKQEYRDLNAKFNLKKEMKANIKTNCVQPENSVSGRCTEATSIECGWPGILEGKCLSMGCCWTTTGCRYPRQDCMDNSLDCHETAGTCETNKYFMLRHCPFTCDVCQYMDQLHSDDMANFCQDYHHQCSNWQSVGECSRNPAYMGITCPLSCGFCVPGRRCARVVSRQACRGRREELCTMRGCCWDRGECFYPDSCRDTDPACPYAAYMGDCDRNPYAMWDRCALSCGTCDTPRSPFWNWLSKYGCKDEVIYQCLQWKAAGECTRNPDYMQANCALTCGICNI